MAVRMDAAALLRGVIVDRSRATGIEDTRMEDQPMKRITTTKAPQVHWFDLFNRLILLIQGSLMSCRERRASTTRGMEDQPMKRITTTKAPKSIGSILFNRLILEPGSSMPFVDVLLHGALDPRNRRAAY